MLTRSVFSRSIHSGWLRLLLVAAVLGLPAIAGWPTPAAAANPTLGTISTVAGTLGDGGPATSALLYGAQLATDTAGNLYVGEQYRVRKISLGTNVITTIAGDGGYIDAGDGGPAIAASFSVSGIAVATNGDVYISDGAHRRVRKVAAATGIITTVAGNGTVGSSGDNGSAVSAQIMYPAGLAIDGTNGALYIADQEDHRVRRVLNGIITTVAGTGVAGFGSNNQNALITHLDHPLSLAIDAGNALYITDTFNERIRKLTFSTGNLTTVAGNGTAGFVDNVTATSEIGRAHV